MTSIPKPKRTPKTRVRRGTRTSRHRAKRKSNLKLVDRLFSSYIRTRDDWACRCCGSVRNIQCAHVVSRRYRAVRWDSDNALALCSRCHVRYTYDPIAWQDWIDEKFPGRMEQLRAKARQGVAHVDYDALSVGLLASIAALTERRK